jgi:hypothetical protein
MATTELTNLFVCDRCGCVDDIFSTPQCTAGEFICHACTTGNWHDHYDREEFNGSTDVINRMVDDTD